MFPTLHGKVLVILKFFGLLTPEINAFLYCFFGNYSYYWPLYHLVKCKFTPMFPFKHWYLQQSYKSKETKLFIYIRYIPETKIHYWYAILGGERFRTDCSLQCTSSCQQSTSKFWPLTRYKMLNILLNFPSTFLLGLAKHLESLVMLKSLFSTSRRQTASTNSLQEKIILSTQ